MIEFIMIFQLGDDHETNPHHPEFEAGASTNWTTRAEMVRVEGLEPSTSSF